MRIHSAARIHAIGTPTLKQAGEVQLRLMGLSAPGRLRLRSCGSALKWAQAATSRLARKQKNLRRAMTPMDPSLNVHSGGQSLIKPRFGS